MKRLQAESSSRINVAEMLLEMKNWCMLNGTAARCTWKVKDVDAK
jgi:hypothetical protein